jgi:hypothetical protein
MRAQVRMPQLPAWGVRGARTLEFAVSVSRVQQLQETLHSGNDWILASNVPDRRQPDYGKKNRHASRRIAPALADQRTHANSALQSVFKVK